MARGECKKATPPTEKEDPPLPPFLNSHTAHFKKATLSTPVHLLKTGLFEGPVSNSLHRLK